MKRLLLVFFLANISMLLAPATYTQGAICVSHAQLAESIYGQFTGRRIDNSTYSEMQVEKIKSDYQFHLRAGSLPEEITEEDVIRFADSFKTPNDEEMTFVYAKKGEKSKKTLIFPENDKRPWTRIQEDLVNNGTRISISHDQKVMMIADSENSANTFQYTYFNPCDLLYPLHASECSTVQKVPLTNGRSLYTSLSPEPNTVKVQALLDDQTGLPIQALLIQRQPPSTALRVMLCEFSDYATSGDRSYPTKWNITVWSQMDEAAFNKMSAEQTALFYERKQAWVMGPSVNFDLTDLNEFTALPNRQQYSLVFAPASLDTLEAEEATLFWASVEEGYRYNDYRERNRATIQSYDRALKNKEEMSDELIQRFHGSGPHTIQP